MTLDFVTGLYYARNRNYSPSLGVWISQDPLQYVNGANTYQMEMSGPVGAMDPGGQQVTFGPLLPPGYSPAITANLISQAYAYAVNGASNVGELGAPVANYIANTLSYPGDMLLGMPTNQGLGWGQGSVVVGLILQSPKFKSDSQKWLQSIVYL